MQYTTFNSFLRDIAFIRRRQRPGDELMLTMLDDLHLQISQLFHNVAGFIFIWRTEYDILPIDEPTLPSNTLGDVSLVHGDYGLAVCFEHESDVAIFKLMQGHD